LEVADGDAVGGVSAHGGEVEGLHRAWKAGRSGAGGILHCWRKGDVALAWEESVEVEGTGVLEGVLCELDQTGTDGILWADAEGGTCPS